MILESVGHETRRFDSCSFFYTGPLIDNSLDDVRKTFDTNTFAILRVAKAVIPEMAKQKQGVIVNIGSIVGQVYVGDHIMRTHQTLIPLIQRHPLEWYLLCIKSSCRLHQPGSLDGMQTLGYQGFSRRSGSRKVEYS